MSAHLDVAFVAGVIDARAHIEPDRARLTVTTRRVDLLRWLAGHTGVTAVTVARDYTRRGCSEHCDLRHMHVVAESRYWTVRGLRAAIIADACLPYVVETRAALASLLRGFTWPADPRTVEIGATMIRAGWPLREPVTS